MNVHSRYPVSPDDFLRWNENREGKREFVDGKVVELMINTTIRHGIIAMRLGAILLRSLAYPQYYAGASDAAVRTSRGVRFPDIFVGEGSSDGGDLGLVPEKPVLLAEILSASSLGRDFVDKAAEYTGIPSMLFYLIVSQEEPRVWLWQRGESGGWNNLCEIDDREERFELGALGVTIDMAELYVGIERR